MRIAGGDLSYRIEKIRADEFGVLSSAFNDMVRSLRERTTALEDSESRYRRLFETARDGILLLNVDTAQIEDVNPYLIELLGYSHAEFLGKKLWEVGAFSDNGQCREIMSDSLYSVSKSTNSKPIFFAVSGLGKAS